MPADKKERLRLQEGRFVRAKKRDGEPDTPADVVEDTPEMTKDSLLERATVCLEEAARSQTPQNEAYTRQAELWMQLARLVSAAP